MRIWIAAACSVLAGCSVLAEDASTSSVPKYVPPVPPTSEALVKGLHQAMKDEMLVGQVQITDIRSATNGGPGAYLICIAGYRKNASSIGYYAAFFENEDFKAVRPAVILDLCEKQSYRPAGL